MANTIYPAGRASAWGASLNFGNLARYVMPGWYFAGQANSAADPPGRLFYAAIYVPRTITYDRIGVSCAVAQASALARLGLYSPHADGSDGMKPGALLLDAGTVDLSGTGAKEIVISQALRAGYYFTALVCDTASVQMERPDIAKAVMPPATGSLGVITGPPSALYSVSDGRIADVAGGLPNPAPALENIRSATSGGFVLLRES